MVIQNLIYMLLSGYKMLNIGMLTNMLKLILSDQLPLALFSDRHEVTALTPQFRVSDVRGRELFSAEDGHVSVGTDILRVMGRSADPLRTGGESSQVSAGSSYFI